MGSFALIGLILTMVIGAICFRILRNRKRGRENGYTSALKSDSEIDLQKLPSNVAYHCLSVKLNSQLEALEYPRNNIIFVRDIGQGAFGRVFQVIKTPRFLIIVSNPRMPLKLLGKGSQHRQGRRVYNGSGENAERRSER